MRLPHVDDPRIISERSEIILRNCLTPEHWGLNKIHQENDYGLDFRVERRFHGRNTGQDFFVQLKGFAKDDGKKNIGLRIETSTINYWKSKLIPILLVAVDCSNNIAYCEWFNPVIPIDKDQQTVTITIPRNKFNTESIANFIEDYYRSFISTINDNESRRIISNLFQDSLVLASAASECFVYLTVVPPSIKDDEERITAVNDALQGLTLVFHSVARYLPNVVNLLDTTGFSGSLSSHLTTLAKFFLAVFFLDSNPGEVHPQKVQPGTVELIFCNREKILASLPTLISTLNALNRELAKQLLRI